MGFGVQECGEEVSVFTWIPENLSGRAVGVPLGCVSVCSIVWGWEEQGIHIQSSAWGSYPHQWVGRWEKNREKCGHNETLPRSRELHGGGRRW